MTQTKNRINKPGSNAEWSAFRQQLSHYVARRVENRFVEDLVAEILLRIVRSEQQWLTAKRPDAWMYQVAKNAITDHYRRQGTENRVLELLNQQASMPVTAEQGYQPAHELAHCLKPLIHALPGHYAQALIRIDLDGLRQADAAREFGVSLPALKSRLRRGRQQLREKLLACCAVELNRVGTIVDCVEHSDCC